MSPSRAAAPSAPADATRPAPPPAAQRRIVPSRRGVMVLAGVAVAVLLGLVLGLPAADAGVGLAVALAAVALWALADLLHTGRVWRIHPLRIERQLPPALALGVTRKLQLTLVNEGPQVWPVDVFDDIDPQLQFAGWPQQVQVPAGQKLDLWFTVTPTRRGTVHLGRTHLKVRSLLGALDILFQVGEPAPVHVYPNFAAVARYAWLAGDRRLSQIGIKTYAQRGTGTDFKQLSDYRPGDPIRHIDWKATLRQRRPVVREYQDERDQCVIFLLDCGRRMRASEDDTGTGPVVSHFDEALNALMLMSYVALKEGDEVGVMTFGVPPGQERHFAPRKGGETLNALMAHLYDIQPQATPSDYIAAAEALLRRQNRRALVVLITNFRDEDASELQPALRLLRARHLVLVASLRERVLRDLQDQPIRQPAQAADVATAHLFEQSRRDAFVRTVGQDALSVDVEPAQLAVALVNRYHAVKRAGLL